MFLNWHLNNGKLRKFKDFWITPFFNFQVCKSTFTLRVEYSGHLLANLFFPSFSVQLMTSHVWLCIFFLSFQRTLKFEVSSPFWKTLKKTLDTHIFPNLFFTCPHWTFPLFNSSWCCCCSRCCCNVDVIVVGMVVWLLLSCCWCICVVNIVVVVVVVTVFFADVVTLATELLLVYLWMLLLLGLLLFSSLMLLLWILSCFCCCCVVI